MLQIIFAFKKKKHFSHYLLVIKYLPNKIKYSILYIIILEYYCTLIITHHLKCSHLSSTENTQQTTNSTRCTFCLLCLYSYFECVEMNKSQETATRTFIQLDVGELNRRNAFWILKSFYIYIYMYEYSNTQRCITTLAKQNNQFQFGCEKNNS